MRRLVRTAGAAPAGGRRAVARAGPAALGVTAALLGVALALAIGRIGRPVPEFARPSPAEWVLWSTMALGLAILGALICSRRPGNAIGPLCAFAGVCSGLAAAAHEWATRGLLVTPGSPPLGTAAAWVASWIGVLTLPLAAMLIALLFPDGHLPSPRWRPVLWGALAVIAAVAIALALVEGPLDEFPVRDNPLGVLPRGAGAVSVALLVLVPVCLTAPIARWRRAAGDERQQLRWVAAAAAAALVAFVAEVPLAGTAYAGLAFTAGIALIAAGAGIAILRYRLYDLDLVVNRALVYGALTALVAGGYVGLVTALGALLDSTGLGVSLLATGVVAVALGPLRAVLQRRVDRMMYGDRRDPYRALSRLASRLGEALDPDEVLPAVVATIADGLRSPHVAIELRDGDAFTAAAVHGRPQGGPLTVLPLEYRGQVVGRLLAAPRSPTEPPTPADRRLLADLARQAGVAAHAVALTADLRRSRERIVAAREEERRRLRRDLHDGLGPALAGIGLQIGTAAGLTERDPEAARALLRRLTAQVGDAIADIRRIAHDLRPPALDDLGLSVAVSEHAARLGAGGGGAPVPRIAVDVPATLPALPAAVEVAAYRIAAEALTNVVRHARAGECRVRISVDAALEVEVHDDGVGLPDGVRNGVGLVSMRERAEELGGRLDVVPGGGGGTLVRAVLPLEVP